MKKIINRVVFIFLSLFPVVTYAASPTLVYEPHKYTREIAKPTEFSDTFKACDPKGSFTLIVQNGDEKGKNRISSGVISVNGVPIIAQSDFNQNVARIERPIDNAHILEQNTIEAKLNSKPWSHITVSVEGIMSCLEVSITEPQDGATINKGSTIIKGTVESQTADVGINVNGILAEINGEEWIAVVPLKEGENILMAIATDGSGNSDEKSVTVNCESTQQPVTISALPQSGIAPLETSFDISANLPGTITAYRIDFDGDGIIDLETTSAENIANKYENSGLYLATVSVEDAAGNVYSESIVINVLDIQQMDELLKGKWTGMKTAMESGDTAATLNFYHSSSQEKYGRVFNDLKDRLPLIAEGMSDIQVDYIRNDVAEYRISRMEEVNSEMMEITYFIYFVKDANGLWKIGSL